MTETKKINLSAMMKHSGKEDLIKKGKSKIISKKIQQVNDVGKNTPQNIDIIGEVSPIIKKSSKINLSTIKAPKRKKVVVEEVVEEIIKDKKTLYYESLTSKVITHKKNKLVLSSLKSPLKIDVNGKKIEEIGGVENSKKHIQGEELKNQETSCEIAKKDEYLRQQTEEDSEEGNVFMNYESEYKKKEKSILGAIKRLTKLADIKKLTKTNKVFVISIIALTITGVSVLFYTNPEIHSIQNYKASILNLTGKVMTKDEVKIYQEKIQNNITWQLNQNNLGGYQLDFEILIKDSGEAVYKFDGNEYQTKSDLDIAIKEKLKVLKKEKIRNYFKNKKE